MNVIKDISSIEFKDIQLSKPQKGLGNEYFSNITYNKKPIYIQTPKCHTKRGVLHNKSRAVCDLYFDNLEFNNFLVNIETKVKNLIYENRHDWFENDINNEDIEYFFNTNVKTNDDKPIQTILRTVNVKKRELSGTQKIEIYDEEENILSYDAILGKNLITIILVKQIRFSNSSFYLDIELKHIMILNNYEIPKLKNDNIKEQKSNKEEPVIVDLENLKVDLNDSIEIKKPSDILHDIYKNAKKKAKEAKKNAVVAYLEAKNIKNTYMIEDSSSDDDNLEESENENENEESDIENLSQISFDDLENNY